MSTVCIIGAGAWGTAIAQLLADNGHQVKIWAREPEVVEDIQTTRINSRYLPEILLHNTIEPFSDIAQAVHGADIVFEAIPVQFMRTVLEQAQPYVSPQATWVVLSKGIEQDSLLLPTQIIDAIYGQLTKKVVIVGPSFAKDLARKQITAVSLASDDSDAAQQVYALVANTYFRPDRCTDVIGVQVGAALKNVITLAIGILDGAGYQDNTKAFVLTRGVQEIAHIATILGGRAETMYGLSGVGDVVLTAMGKSSKNLALGRQLGSGKRLTDIEKEIGALPEGVNTVLAMRNLMQRYQISAPVCAGVYAMLYEAMPVERFLIYQE